MAKEEMRAGAELASARASGSGAVVERPHGYRRPEVYSLGRLEQVQRGYKGNNYDGSSRWWYYE